MFEECKRIELIMGSGRLRRWTARQKLSIIEESLAPGEPVIGSSELRKLDDRARELEYLLGRKTMEVEILREALAKAD